MEKEEWQAIRRECLRRTVSLRVAIAALILIPGAVSVLTFLFLRAIPGGPKLQEYAGFATGVIVVWVALNWRQRRALRVLPTVLAEHGRCRQCAYRLLPENLVCPECGARIERESASEAPGDPRDG